jgi:predicted nucleic acid-binding Zn ribbon protein
MKFFNKKRRSTIKILMFLILAVFATVIMNPH